MELIIEEGAFIRLTILKDHLAFLTSIVLPDAFED